MSIIETYRACDSVNLEMLKKHLNVDDINYSKFTGFTPLGIAVLGCHSHIVDYLIEKSADVNCKDKSGETAIIIAADIGNSEIAKKLIDSGANINEFNNGGLSILMTFVSWGYPDFLIDLGANIDFQCKKNGETALMLAVQLNKFDMVDLLVKRGADISIKNNKGKTAFDFSYKIDNPEMILLLKNKPINFKDENGDTLLIKACQDKKEQLVLFLYEKALDVDFYTENKNGESALKILKRKRGLPARLHALKESLTLSDIIEHVSLHQETLGGSL